MVEHIQTENADDEYWLKYWSNLNNKDKYDISKGDIFSLPSFGIPWDEIIDEELKEISNIIFRSFEAEIAGKGNASAKWMKVKQEYNMAIINAAITHYYKGATTNYRRKFPNKPADDAKEKEKKEYEYHLKETSHCFVQVRDKLIEKDYVIDEIAIGGNYFKHQSVFLPAPALLKLIRRPDKKPKIIRARWKPNKTPLVVVRNKEKQDVPFDRNTEEIQRMEKILRGAMFQFRLFKPHIWTNVNVLTELDINLFRCFLDDLTKHGRIYSTGNNSHFSYERNQRLNLVWRPTPLCLIPSVEYDHSNFYIRLAYNLEGLPLDGDPYIFDKKIKRIYAKKLIPIMFNCDDWSEVSKGFHTERMNNPDLKTAYYGARSLGYQLKDIYQLMLDIHKLIKHWFNKKSGLLLQKRESDLLMSLLEFTNEIKKPLIPCHDSYMTTPTAAPLVLDYIDNLFYKLTGFKPKLDQAQPKPVYQEKGVWEKLEEFAIG